MESKQPIPKPHWWEHFILIVVALVMTSLDQLSKRLIEANIPIGFTEAPIEAISPYLTLTRTQNTGAAFSFFRDGNIFFILVAIVVSLVIVYYAPRLPKGDWISRVALGLQLTGALGNLIDRLRQGFVTDWIHFQIPQINFDWPVFNIADSSIFVGVIMLIVVTLWRDRAMARQIKAAENQPSG
jgi:signal peptidase II